MPATSAARFGGLLRLVHPFPSLLDAAVTAAIAAIAGAGAGLVALLAGAMLLLQLGIGAANDWADAAADRTAQPGKPVPSGLVRRSAAARIAFVAAAAGLGLAALAGPAPLAVAAVGLGAGLAYDLRLKGTRWSWVPYAIGIPLLPVFAWLGATASLPAPFAVLVPIAMVAGAALAVANALADLERDRDAGTATVATSLGLHRARRTGAVLHGVVLTAALGSALAFGGDPAWIALASAGSVFVAGGLALGWNGGQAARRRAWEVQAVGVGIVAGGWLGALAAAGRLAG
jgi:4-hydroxybenzoate polyprenyltransferase